MISKMSRMQIFCPVQAETKMKLRGKKVLQSAASDTRGRSRWKLLSKLRVSSAMHHKMVISHLERCLQWQRKVTGMRVPTSWIQWEKCRLRFSRQWNPATQLSERRRVIRRRHRFTKLRHVISFEYQNYARQLATNGCFAIKSNPGRLRGRRRD